MTLDELTQAPLRWPRPSALARPLALAGKALQAAQALGVGWWAAARAPPRDHRETRTVAGHGDQATVTVEARDRVAPVRRRGCAASWRRRCSMTRARCGPSSSTAVALSATRRACASSCTARRSRPPLHGGLDPRRGRRRGAGPRRRRGGALSRGITSLRSCWRPSSGARRALWPTSSSRCRAHCAPATCSWASSTALARRCTPRRRGQARAGARPPGVRGAAVSSRSCAQRATPRARCPDAARPVDPDHALAGIAAVRADR